MAEVENINFEESFFNPKRSSSNATSNEIIYCILCRICRKYVLIGGLFLIVEWIILGIVKYYNNR